MHLEGGVGHTGQRQVAGVIGDAERTGSLEVVEQPPVELFHELRGRSIVMELDRAG